jgi:hypothetical protein
MIDQKPFFKQLFNGFEEFRNKTNYISNENLDNPLILNEP